MNSEDKTKIIGLSIFASVSGALLIGLKAKKNSILFASIGAIAIGLITYNTTKIFVSPK